MFCKNCGASIDDSTTYCGSCGARVEQPTTIQQTQKSHKGLIAIIIILIVLLIGVCGGIWYFINMNNEAEKEDVEAVDNSFEDEDEDEEDVPKKNKKDEEDSDEDDSEDDDFSFDDDDTDSEDDDFSFDDNDTDSEDDDFSFDDDDTDLDNDSFNPLEDTLLYVDKDQYEKVATYKTEMNVSNMQIQDYQVIMANSDKVTVMWEITTIDMSSYSETEKSAIADTYEATYQKFKDKAPESVEVIYGLFGDYYRFEMAIHLEDADMAELIENGFLNVTAGDKDNFQYISYKQTCDSMNTLGYTLVE